MRAAVDASNTGGVGMNVFKLLLRLGVGAALSLSAFAANAQNYPAPKEGDLVHAEVADGEKLHAAFFKVVSTRGGVWLAPAFFVIRETGPRPIDVELTEDVDPRNSFAVDANVKLKGVVCARRAIQKM
mgnify:CR=1 FL=1